MNLSSKRYYTLSHQFLSKLDNSFSIYDDPYLDMLFVVVPTLSELKYLKTLNGRPIVIVIPHHTHTSKYTLLYHIQHNFFPLLLMMLRIHRILYILPQPPNLLPLSSFPFRPFNCLLFPTTRLPSPNPKPMVNTLQPRHTRAQPIRTSAPARLRHWY